MDPADTTRDEFASRPAAGALTGWREEVRSFLEKTLDDIQRLSADLWCGARDADVPRATARTAQSAAARPATPAREPTDDPMDASQTRLENLKRRLSEKLRHQSSEKPGDQDRPREDPRS